MLLPRIFTGHLPPSSSGLGRQVLILETGVRLARFGESPEKRTVWHTVFGAASVASVPVLRCALRQGIDINHDQARFLPGCDGQIAV